MDDLKDRPFCGGSASIYTIVEYDKTYYQPRCDTCDCIRDNLLYKESDAIRAWNTRNES